MVKKNGYFSAPKKVTQENLFSVLNLKGYVYTLMKGIKKTFFRNLKITIKL